MSRYRCTRCEIEFADDSEHPRCPRCLRQHGIEALTGTGPKQRPPRARLASRSRLVWGLAVLVALTLVAGGGLLLYWHRSLPRPGELAQLEPEQRRRTLIARGVPESEVQDPFASSEALRALAGKASGAGAAERARSLARELTARLRKGGLAVDVDGTADQPVRTAAELYAALAAGKAKAALSFELASLMVALLRAADLDADTLLCQVHRLKAPVATGDIAGGIGRYAAAVYADKAKLGAGPLLVLDPARALDLPAWAGGGRAPAMESLHADPKSLEPLDDASAAAHLLGLRGFRQRTRAPERAYRLSELALEAASPSATLHLLRAKVLSSAGGAKDAAAEAQKALALKDGPPQRTLLALALASEGQLDQSQSHLEQALRQDPKYWPAHAALATLLMVTDPKRGQQHLDAGLAVAAEEPALLTLLASRLLAEDKVRQAADVLRRAAAARPNELILLMLYQTLLRAKDPDEARLVRKQLLDRVNPKDRERLTKLLAAIDEAVQGPASGPVEQPPPPSPPQRITLPDVSFGR